AAPAVGRHNGQGVNVSRTEALTDGLPGTAGVTTAVQAVDLDAAPDCVGSGRVGEQSRHARMNDPWTLLEDAHGRLRPGAAAVAGAEQPRGAGAGKDHIGIMRE